MMRRLSCFFLLALLTIPFNLKAQNTGEVRLYYGLAESGFFSFSQVEGAAGHSATNFSEFGIRYIHHTFTSFSLATGINFLNATVSTTPSPGSQPSAEAYSETLRMLSIPLLLHVRVGKFFFINGGPMLDLQLTDSTHDLQSGFGFALGVGASYAFDQFTVFVNPNLKSHALIPFEEERYHQRLAEAGLQLGVGYKF
jgi:hypothetical protein